MPIVITIPHWVIYVVVFLAGCYVGTMWRLFTEHIFGR